MILLPLWGKELCTLERGHGKAELGPWAWLLTHHVGTAMHTARLRPREADSAVAMLLGETGGSAQTAGERCVGLEEGCGAPGAAEQG